VPMSLRVALRPQASFTWVQDVAAHGVGNVARNTVANIMIHRLDRSSKQPKIIIRPIAAAQRKDSKRRITVLVVILVTVRRDGDKPKPPFTLIPRNAGSHR